MSPLRSTGTKCNHDAIGALVKLHFGKEVMVRQVQPASGYIAQSSKTLHFGLGDRQKIDRVEIFWPGERCAADLIDNPEINKLQHHPAAEVASGVGNRHRPLGPDGAYSSDRLMRV